MSDLAAFVIVLFWVGGIAALENAGVDVETVALWGPVWGVLLAYWSGKAIHALEKTKDAP